MFFTRNINYHILNFYLIINYKIIETPIINIIEVHYNQYRMHQKYYFILHGIHHCLPLCILYSLNNLNQYLINLLK